MRARGQIRGGRRPPRRQSSRTGVDVHDLGSNENWFSHQTERVLDLRNNGLTWSSKKRAGCCRRAPPGYTPRTSFGATGSSLASTCYDGPVHCASWPNGKDGGDWVTVQGGTCTTMTGARNEDVPKQLQTCRALATTRCGQSSLEETDAPVARMIGTSGAGDRCWVRLAHNGPAVWACRSGREDGQRQSRPASKIVQLIWVHLVLSSSCMAAKSLMSTGLGHRLCPLPFTYPSDTNS